MKLDKRKETKKKTKTIKTDRKGTKTQKKEKEKKLQRKNKQTNKQTVVLPSPQAMWQTLEMKQPGKKEDKPPLLVNRVGQRTIGEKKPNQSTKHPSGSGSSLWYE